MATLRRVLKEETLVSPNEVFSIERSLSHGHVELILEAIKRRTKTPFSAAEIGTNFMRGTSG
ncbi:MAG: hypothetical protein KZQ99_16420 [Candidatus Thiodiazotropha sp. (ex Dulcina madagascariensis)]|nr:hypothetical protein [Candidatus Thiodiazotropha sp. (ex Dulcina madagascariensis)]